MKIRLSARARRDLVGIPDYLLTVVTPDQAEQTVDRLERRCRSLTSMPARGARLTSLGFETLRYVAEPPFRIIYRVDPDALVVARIVYVSRHLEDVLGRDGSD